MVITPTYGGIIRASTSSTSQNGMSKRFGRRSTCEKGDHVPPWKDARHKCCRSSVDPPSPVGLSGWFAALTWFSFGLMAVRFLSLTAV
jgi:hypothetical protein